MLPSVLPTEADHVPVLADEVVANLDPRPGETVIDCTFGAGGHSELLANRLNGNGKLIAIDRDPTVAPYFERFRRQPRREDAAPARRVLARAPAARRERRPRRRDPDRPRCVVDADRPARARLLVRRRRAARHAHGPERERVGARARERDPTSATSPTSSARSARSATPARSRARSCNGASNSRSSAPASSSRRSSPRSRRRPASARGTRRSACSRRSGSK